MKKLILAALVLSGLAAVQVTAAGNEIYKWTDAQGKVHYGTKPPPGVTASEVKITETSGVRLLPPNTQTREWPAKAPNAAEEAPPKKRCFGDETLAEARAKGCSPEAAGCKAMIGELEELIAATPPGLPGGPPMPEDAAKRIDQMRERLRNLGCF